jgi:hypothetical protein
MTKRAIHRVTADSEAGRRLQAANARHIEGPGPTPEQREWNSQVEAKRQAKLERRAARKSAA